MLKKEIKSIFKAIRNQDFNLVKKLIDEKPELINACNFSPPKKDDGQSPLQVAFKVGQFEIAELLISKGANVNFIEQSTVNEWTAPVIHDCIRAIIFSTLFEPNERFEYGLKILNQMILNGADVNAEDSYGNNCLHRAILDSRQVVTHPDVNISLAPTQLKQVFDTLTQTGANPDQGTDNRSTAKEMITTFDLEKYKFV
ncbi:MAG: ankyrin repeat domain-containing protein [Bacilli bacterium]|nr:ankyrin repeat domain-containing protein [Bacilli bacterium]